MRVGIFGPGQVIAMLVFSFPFQTEEQEQPLNRKRVVCYQLADDPLVIIKVKV